jgi:GntR family transcriptional regulator
LTFAAICPTVIGQKVGHVLFQINFKSGKPAYLQLVDQVKVAAASGVLHPGEALPSIRPLAEQLRLNRNTIAKAYSELEGMGVIESLPGKGCFLKQNHSPLRKEIRRKLLVEEIDQAVVMAHHLQVPGPEFLKLIQERMEALENKRRANEDPKEK